MPALVVHAHPVPDSLSRALFESAVDALTVDGPPPGAASLCDGDDPDERDLAGVDTLVFVHPTWWGGPPAVLLDWIGRRLGPWIDGQPAEPSPIAGVTTLAVVTTHGSPFWVNRMTGEPGRHLFADSIRPLCAPSCEWHWIAHYGIDAGNAEKRNAFVASVPTRLRAIATRGITRSGASPRQN